ncbi:MAG TPA: alpha/beta hydrolase [Candidatus Limnocylindrales bacterium]
MPAEPESMSVTLDTGDRLHYLDWRRPTDQPAGGLPPLLLVHGLAQTAWAWAPIARRLADAAHVLALDLRGHGLSDSPRTGYELESLAFDALTVLTANGYGVDAGGPPAVVAGHGLGALVAATMADLRPSSVAGLALVDAGWERMAEATGLDAAEFGRTIGDPPEVLASMAAYLADRRDYDPPSWDADQERAARAAVDEKHAGHVALVTRVHALRGAVAAMFEYDPAMALLSWAGPLLVCVAESGSADDEAARDRRLALDELLARRAAGGRAAARVARFAGAGHNLMRYRPAEMAAALVELLTEAAAYQRS